MPFTIFFLWHIQLWVFLYPCHLRLPVPIHIHVLLHLSAFSKFPPKKLLSSISVPIIFVSLHVKERIDFPHCILLHAPVESLWIINILCQVSDNEVKSDICVHKAQILCCPLTTYTMYNLIVFIRLSILWWPYSYSFLKILHMSNPCRSWCLRSCKFIIVYKALFLIDIWLMSCNCSTGVCYLGLLIDMILIWTQMCPYNIWMWPISSGSEHTLDQDFSYPRSGLIIVREVWTLQSYVLRKNEWSVKSKLGICALILWRDITSRLKKHFSM